MEHLLPQLHLILVTRADPPLPLSLLRARGEMLEVRTHQLRCMPEEVRAFFQEVMGMQLPENLIQEVSTRTEGWLVGLQLLGLSLQGQTDPTDLLEEVSGSQHYILDYLMEEVLRRLPSPVQTFLLRTSILERLSAPLCDAVLEQTDSQKILEFLERANVFVVPLNGQRRWYRYHALFAEALRARLEETEGEKAEMRLTGELDHQYEPMSPLLEPLSERELEVLRLMEQGSSNQEIAEALVLALSTVKSHVGTILSKLGASNRTQAVKRARTLGLLPDQP